jgi:hypothetical protein
VHRIFRRSSAARKTASKEGNAEQAPSAATRQSPRMNYHNFASRISLPRLSSIPQTKLPAKPARKPVRRPLIRRSLATAAAAAILLSLSLRSEATSQTETVRVGPPPRMNVNTPTLIVTITGLAVALLRVPGLWRRDFVG